MEFSVLLSLYIKEKPENLVDCLESLRSQTVQPDEIILVEDGELSSELHAIVDRYTKIFPQMRIVTIPQNGGLGNALAYGLGFCSYELVARMDTDDIAKPNRFERQLEVYANHPEYDVVGAWIDEFQGTKENIISTRSLPEHHADIYEFGKRRNPLNHPVVMFRKSAVLNAGNYKHILLFEDYYLWSRMLVNGAKFYNIQESLLWFRTTEDLYKRRGGIKYAQNEAKLFHAMRDTGYISTARMVQNICVRFVGRIIPNSWRAFAYQKMLR